jgi:hypothetical protein
MSNEQMFWGLWLMSFGTLLFSFAAAALSLWILIHVKTSK